MEEKSQEVVEPTETQEGFQQIVIEIKVEESEKILEILDGISKQLQGLDHSISRSKK